MDPIKVIKDVLPGQIGKLPEVAVASSSSRPKASASVQRPQGEKILELMKEELGVSDIKLDYSVHKPTGQIVVKILDGETGEVIREIPPKELLALAESMKELEGLLFNKSI
jgi:flagellar protein FlaG